MRLWTLVVTAVGLSFAPEPPQKDAPPTATYPGELPGKDEKLRQELLRRMKEDQDARKPIMALLEKQKGADPDSIKKMELPEVKRMKEIDLDNVNRMKQIVKQFGWPGKSLVGTDGAQAAWILVQHADHDRPFQKQCLEMVKEAVKKGEATGEQFAYLTDRVRLGEKKKQLYGTQFDIVAGKFQPLPIEDEKDVDKRRQEVGLSSLADYLKFSQWALEQSAKSKAGPN